MSRWEFGDRGASTPVRPRGEETGLHDKTAGMTTPRRSSISWSLLAVAAGALTLAACKKADDSKPPEDGGGVSRAEDNGGDAPADADDDAAPEFLTVDVFEDVMNAKTGEVTECFAAAKEKTPALGGKLMLEFTIDGTGKVSAVKTEDASTVKDPGLTTCVTDKAKAWEFPKTRDGQTMTLAFAFNLS